MFKIFSNRITVAKLMFMTVIASLVVFYNVKLFTADDNDDSSIKLSEIYYKWAERKTSLMDVIQLTARIKKQSNNSYESTRGNEVNDIQAEHKSEVFFVDNQYVEGFIIKNKIESIDGITVERDELVYVKFCELERIGNDNKTVKEEFRVEFWSSPINYNGYKKQKNKIILYGIEDVEEVSFKFAGSKLCLHYGQAYFELDESKDFQQLSPVSDKDLIAILTEDGP